MHGEIRSDVALAPSFLHPRFKTICLRDVALIAELPYEITCTITSMGSNSRSCLKDLGYGLGTQKQYQNGRRGLPLARWLNLASNFIVTLAAYMRYSTRV